MEIKINIKDDEDLKKELKVLLKGQVKSLVREEIREIATEILKEKFDKALTPDVIERIFKNEISEKVKSNLGINSWNNNFVKEEARNQIGKIVSDLFKSYYP